MPPLIYMEDCQDGLNIGTRGDASKGPLIIDKRGINNKNIMTEDISAQIAKSEVEDRISFWRYPLQPQIFWPALGVLSLSLLGYFLGT